MYLCFHSLPIQNIIREHFSCVYEHTVYIYMCSILAVLRTVLLWTEISDFVHQKSSAATPPVWRSQPVMLFLPQGTLSTSPLTSVLVVPWGSWTSWPSHALSSYSYCQPALNHLSRLLCLGVSTLFGHFFFLRPAHYSSWIFDDWLGIYIFKTKVVHLYFIFSVT